MHEFVIPRVDGSGGLTFFDRSPPDPETPLESFWVRLTDHNLSAAALIWGGYSGGSPVRLFDELARRWSALPDELCWQSLEGEIRIRCNNDRRGHIYIRVRLQSGFLPAGWEVESTVTTEIGQLEGIAGRAREFFGSEGLH